MRLIDHEVRRGCHAIAYAQPTARLRLRNSRRMNSGCPNCSTLCWIDTHEFPFGSIPPVAPVFSYLFRGIGAERCRRQQTDKGDANYGTDDS